MPGEAQLPCSGAVVPQGRNRQFHRLLLMHGLRKPGN